jgi:hypothetical protein
MSDVARKIDVPEGDPKGRRVVRVVDVQKEFGVPTVKARGRPRKQPQVTTEDEEIQALLKRPDEEAPLSKKPKNGAPEGDAKARLRALFERHEDLNDKLDAAEQLKVRLMAERSEIVKAIYELGGTGPYQRKGEKFTAIARHGTYFLRSDRAAVTNV